MKKFFAFWPAIFATFAALAAPVVASPAVEDMKITYVIDGDTAVAFSKSELARQKYQAKRAPQPGAKRAKKGKPGELRLRFWGIDAPESKQAYGRECTQLLRRKITGRTLRVRIMDTDRYGRKIARLWLGAEDINRFMVRSGCAWAYRRYSMAYAADEAAARKARRGLWQQLRPIEPERWRRMHAKPHRKGK